MFDLPNHCTSIIDAETQNQITEIAPQLAAIANQYSNSFIKLTPVMFPGGIALSKGQYTHIYDDILSVLLFSDEKRAQRDSPNSKIEVHNINDTTSTFFATVIENAVGNKTDTILFHPISTEL